MVLIIVMAVGCYDSCLGCSCGCCSSGFYCNSWMVVAVVVLITVMAVGCCCLGCSCGWCSSGCCCDGWLLL